MTQSTDPATPPPGGVAVSPEARNVGEGFKKAKHEMTDDRDTPEGLVPAFKFFMERFGHMMSRVVLTVLYVVLIAPIGVVYRFVADPFMLRGPKGGSSFTKWASKNDSLRDARRQG